MDLAKKNALLPYKTGRLVYLPKIGKHNMHMLNSRFKQYNPNGG